MLKSNKLTGMVLAQIEFNFLNHSGLYPLNCVSITTDNCATMSSPTIEACAELKKRIKHATVSYCLNHVNNLSLLDSFKVSNEIQSVIKLIKALKAFFCSAKRQKVTFEEIL